MSWVVPAVQLRAPRPNTHGVQDSPASNIVNGASAICLGGAALVFAARSARRVQLEKRLIDQMWEKKTTVRSLRELAERGVALPQMVLLRGRIDADGEPVRSLSAQICQLRPLIGCVEQRTNIFLQLAVAFGNRSTLTRQDQGMMPRDEAASGAVAAISGKSFRGLSFSDGQCVVAELLLSRLGCVATRRTKTDKNGAVKVKITRSPRAASFNVMHVQQTASGLHVICMAGERAELALPTWDPSSKSTSVFASSSSPALFLTLPEAHAEFNKSHLSQAESDSNAGAHAPLTHLSKFISIDQQSSSDDGSFDHTSSASSTDDAPAASSSSSSSSYSAFSSSSSSSNLTALEEIGGLFPGKCWHWNGLGFYDSRPGPWSVRDVDT